MLISVSRTSHRWSDFQIIEQLKLLGIVLSTVSHWESELDKIMAKGIESTNKIHQSQKNQKNEEETMLSTGSCRVLQSNMMNVQFILVNEYV